jgi:ribonuclease VapC
VSNVVYDTTIPIAILKAERLDIQPPDVRWATMSAVNVAEVWTLMATSDASARLAAEELLRHLRVIAPFTEEQARLAGALQAEPGVKGLSLGDRACLALAILTGAEVYTADWTWSRLKLPCVIHQVRPRT